MLPRDCVCPVTDRLSYLVHQIVTAVGSTLAMTNFRQTVVQLYAERGSMLYDGEGVDQLCHGWQCAMLAKLSNATAELCLASFLHDVGHLFSLQETPTKQSINDNHEHFGADFLSQGFPEAVVEPIRLHVSAKRFLVTKNPSYGRALSEDSKRSLALQGGPMTMEECEAFIALPFAMDAIRLRVWDEHGKDARCAVISRDEMLLGLRALMERRA